MALHRTKSGWIELVDRYGHGKSPKNEAQHAPAHLTVEYDGWTTVWKFSGKLRDAAITASAFDLPNDGRSIGTLEGNHVSFDPTPDDFWLDETTRQPPTEETGQMVANLTAYPDTVAY